MSCEDVLSELFSLEVNEAHGEVNGSLKDLLTLDLVVVEEPD